MFPAKAAFRDWLFELCLPFHLMREGIPIGVIGLRRMEVRAFHGQANRTCQNIC